MFYNFHCILDFVVYCLKSNNPHGAKEINISKTIIECNIGKGVKSFGHVLLAQGVIIHWTGGVLTSLFAVILL